MSITEFADAVKADLLNNGYQDSDGEFVFMQTTSSMAVIRFKDHKNRCVVATVGFCNAATPEMVRKIVIAKGEEMPASLPNGAEIPLWLTVHDAVL